MFTKNVLFTDESTFYNDCTVNQHNSHYYAVENPRWVMDNYIQDRWGVNVWGGVIGRHVIGPYFFDDGAVNGERYLQLLQEDLDDLLEDVPLAVLQRMWFMQDGAFTGRGLSMLDRVNACTIRRLGQCIERNGQAFEHLFYE
ncbi:Ribosome maturation factor RimP [Frankliniella fusca]|uniref:Ribosome maturation factor RimP n=1 Tax=Frankliniella fusca TaxID=407009 RepID=A0AAE1I7D5_9NEOP|nr:Ribosome maturation factor RimP [Frankliniella fusca]